jgi:hypothetical protein
MPLRLLATLLLALTVGYACSPRGGAHPSEAPVHHRAADAPPVSSQLAVNVGSDVTFALSVFNESGKKIEITFPNGRTHEIVVKDSQGREQWRWSEGRMFTQTVRNSLVDDGDTLRYEDSWSPALPPGTYVAVATLNSETHPLESSATFTLR